jgi:hypothetical protein
MRDLWPQGFNPNWRLRGTCGTKSVVWSRGTVTEESMVELTEKSDLCFLKKTDRKHFYPHYD